MDSFLEKDVKGMEMKINTDIYQRDNPTAPWLSVVVPIYNAEKYLPRCIESVLSQSFEEYELILIDDGSQDSSIDLCKHYAEIDRRIRCYQKENGGSYQTRLFGAEHSMGNYVTFCDADDYYASHKTFEIIHAAIADSHCSALQFGYYKRFNHLMHKYSPVKEALLVDKDDFQSREYPKLLCSFWDASHLTPNVWNKVYARNLLKNLPACSSGEKAFWGDDLVMNLSLLKTASSMLFLPDALYVYQQGSGGTNSFKISTMDDLDFIKRHQLQNLKMRENRDDNDSIESILHSETAGWFYLWVRQALNNLDEKDVYFHVKRVLELPSFRSTRQFYEEHGSDESVPAFLMRKADPEAYIDYAKKANREKNTDIKGILRSTLKKIYVSV